MLTVVLLAIGVQDGSYGQAPVEGKIYWTEAKDLGWIQRANLDGSNLESLLTTELEINPDRITLDPVVGKIYWTEVDIEAEWEGTIRRANFDGSEVETLITGLQDPFDLALDLFEHKIYWTDLQGGTIQRADLEGTNVEILITGLEAPADIALDMYLDFIGDPCPNCTTKIQTGFPLLDRRVAAKSAFHSPYHSMGAPTTMYWTDLRAGTIQRADLDGENAEILVTDIGSPVGIVVNEYIYSMYWADGDTGIIHRADLDGANVEALVTGVEDIISIAQESYYGYYGEIVWMEWNSDSDTGTIRCCYGWDESGPYTIVETKRPKDLEVSLGWFYWTDANRIYWYEGDEGSEPIYMGIEGPASIAVDAAEDKMYWVDKRLDAIRRSNLDGTQIKNLLTGVEEPEDISLDLVAGKMYWMERGTNSIRRADLDGENVENLVEVEDPQSIALDVTNGKMYWTSQEASRFSDRGIIRRADLDGENVETLLTGLYDPESIALDLVSGKMYWTDFALVAGARVGVDGGILRANLDGSKLEILVPHLARPVDLALDVTGDKMYWTDEKGGSIHQANLDGENAEEIVSGLVRPVGIALDVLPPAATPDAVDITQIPNPDPCANGLVVPNPLQNQGLVEDCRALLAFRNSRDERSDLSWSTAFPISRWRNVYIRDARVREIHLGDSPIDPLNIDGPISPELGNLTALESLSLAGVSGLIPPELGNLTALESLSLAGVSGPIPPELGNLTTLESLSLAGVSGPIPTELGQLTQLRRLYISWNREISGPIPPELGNLTGLEYLSLAGVSGPIPPELGNLTNLTSLVFSDDELMGPIPPELGNLTNLKKLALGNNSLTGPIPPELGSLTNLTSLILNNNKLTGPIPPELGNLTNLTFLSLSYNELTGPIPPELGQMPQLEFLEISHNRLTGPIPPELGQLTSLQSLNLFNNELTGPIPPELGQMTSLQRLNLNNNKLTGSIPPELSQLTSLQSLSIHRNNQLTGCVPAPLAKWIEDWPICSGTAVFVPDCCWQHIDGIWVSRRRVLENTPPRESLGPVQTQSADDAILTFSLAGPDSAAFAIDDAGEITVGPSTMLDFEAKESYSIVVYLSDGLDHQGLADPSIDDTLRVTIELINVEEAGTVRLSSTHPVIGDSLTATLSDPDGLASYNPPRWQWQRSEDLPTLAWDDIPRARYNVYTPTTEDEGRLLRATATYGDGHGSNKSAESDPTAAVATSRSATATAADFDGDGMTDFADFFLFADHFGSNDARFDLDGSGVTDFADFFLFADHFDPPARVKLVMLARELIGLPNNPQLQQNAPNPFNSETILSYFLNTPGPTHLEVFALTGQKVAVLHQGPQQAGYHRLRWNGHDDAGRPVASGMYLYRLVTADGVLTRKLILLR